MKTLLLILSVFIQFTLSAQTTYFIKATGTGSGNSWANASSNLQYIIDNAAAGDSIFVASGTYQPAAGISFFIKNGIKIYGNFTGTEANFAERDLTKKDSSVLLGNGATVLSLKAIDSTTLLDGFTITGGIGHSGLFLTAGGGIYDSASSPIISNCVFRNNTSGYGGGGMFNTYASKPHISNCIFKNNSAGSGGGIYNEKSSIPVITNSIFDQDTAQDNGGAISCDFSYPIVTNSTFSNNVSLNNGGGGAISTYYSLSPLVTNCVFYNNSAKGDGGAIVDNSYYPVYTNCTFSKNSSTGNGGAIITTSNLCTVANCMFWGNTAAARGSDIYVPPGDILPIVTYCYLQIFNSGTGNILGNSNPFINQTNPLGNDGIFMTADDGLHLTSIASALDTGNIASIPAGITTDITGAGRLTNGEVNMGAYQGSATPIRFTGTILSGIAQLNWQTGIEDSFNYFELQKSTDSITFTPIDTAVAKGNNSIYTYSLAQTKVTSYYRLRIVDNSGRYGYSNVVSLTQTFNSNTLPILTMSDIPQQGDLFIYQDAQVSNIPVTDTGANKIWDYSTIVDSSSNLSLNFWQWWDSYDYWDNNYTYTTASSNLSFSSPVNTPFASSFPASNLVEYNVDGLFRYFQVTADSLKILGYGRYVSIAPNIGANVDTCYFNDPYDGPFFFLVYPFTYGSYSMSSATGIHHYHNNYQDATDFNGNISIMQGTGFGTLKLPAITYNNVLQITQTVESHTGADNQYETIAYNSFYFVPGIRFYVLEVQKSAAGKITSVSYLKNVTVPVTLLNFNATPSDNKVQLSWQTANEINNNHFVVQKGADGSHFLDMQQVSASSSSAGTHSYSAIDDQPFNGNNYYRLKQVDNNGNYTFSKIDEVSFSEINTVQIAPNPVQSNNLSLITNNQKALQTQLSITDVTGKLVLSKTVNIDAGLQTQQINVAPLSAGSYIFSITIGGNKKVMKFIKE